MKIIIYLFFFFFSSSAFSMDNVEEIEISNKKIDREGIRKVFLSKQKDLTECYNKSLLRLKDPSKSQGKMVLDFTIDEDGSLMYISLDNQRSALKNYFIAGCIAKKAYTWTFPKPPSGQNVQVYYPLSFTTSK